MPLVQGGTLLAIAGAFLASFFYGVAANYVKTQLASVHAWVTTGGSLVFAALLLLPLAFWQRPDQSPSTQAWLVVVLLAVLCTSIPNIYYFRLVISAGPTRAMAVAFLIPVFGMLWGALVLDEVGYACDAGGLQCDPSRYGIGGWIDQPASPLGFWPVCARQFPGPRPVCLLWQQSAPGFRADCCHTSCLWLTAIYG